MQNLLHTAPNGPANCITDSQKPRNALINCEKNRPNIENNTNNKLIVRKQKRRITLKVGLSNARSLWPKMASLVEFFAETDSDMAVISETWFFKSEALSNLSARVGDEHGLGLINHCRKRLKNRPNPGGGVSIIFRKNKLNMKPLAVNVKGKEICVAEGKLEGQARTLCVVACYLSTRLTPSEGKEYMNVLSDVLGEIETKKTTAEIIVAGDFNRVNLAPTLDLHPRIEILATPPTRLDAHLDLMATTLKNNLIRAEYMPPLEPGPRREGVPSDHSFLLCEFEINMKHEFTDASYLSRVLDEAAVAEYSSTLESIDWPTTLGDINHIGIDTFAETFHRVLRSTVDSVAPLKKRKRKSTDKPWINDNLKKMTEKRKRLFKGQERSANWKEVKKITTKMARECKRKFFLKETAKLTTPGSHQLPYKALDKLREDGNARQFDVLKMWPDLTEEEILEKLSAYFSDISGEYPPLTDDFIRDLTKDMEDNDASEEWTEIDTIGLVSKYKLPKTTVSIDPPVQFLAATFTNSLWPMTEIFRAILNGQQWPAIWKKEEVSVIPKKTNPDAVEELRNISCTSVFSKLMESVLLRRLQAETSLSPNQYGGLKGCGTTHLLATLNTRIMEILDTPGSAVGILTIDFNKAFNRMSHEACLRALRHKGASKHTILMVSGFLRERFMRVKIGNKMSAQRSTPGGAPQGTCSGNYLFSLTIDGIEKDEFARIHEIPDNYDSSHPSSSPDMGHGEPVQRLTSFETNCAGMQRSERRAMLDTSPPAAHWSQDRIAQELGLREQENSCVLQYVDDFTAIQRLDIESGISHITTSKERREVHAGSLQKTFDTVQRNAKAIGMQIHPGKTKILCISAAKHSHIEAYMMVDDEKISGSPEIKLLGTIISSSPNQWANVHHLRRKFAARSWSLGKLKRAGIPKSALTKTYTTYLRPLLEYATPAFSSLLNAAQAESIERCQRLALKNIFGFRESYAACLDLSGLDTLEERRRGLTRKFALKTYVNDRFTHSWFPERLGVSYGLRKRGAIEEKNAATERFRNAPIERMKQILNEEEILPDRSEPWPEDDSENESNYDSEPEIPDEILDAYFSHFD